MAKLTVTVAIFLFVLALAQARIALVEKENDVITEDLSANIQEPDPKTTATWPVSILLPSQNKDSETETDAKPQTSEPEKPETETNDFLPLTVMNFHPINRHFRHHPSLFFRNRRPCHHHNNRWGQSRFHHREMTYGNDMLASEGDSKEEEVRDIPEKWLQLSQGDAHVHRFHFWRDDDVAKKQGFRRPHHFHHFYRHQMADGEKEGGGQEQEAGFMKKIRKFLNHF